MSQHVSWTAIQTTDTRAALNTLQSYYQQQQLSLVEEQIDGRPTLVPPGKEHFASYQDYVAREIQPLIGQRVRFCTNFNLRVDPAMPGWVVLLFLTRPQLTQLMIGIDAALSRLLSESLSCSVIDYYRYDVPSVAMLTHFRNGLPVDSYQIGDLHIEAGTGFFESYYARADDLQDYTGQLNPLYAFFEHLQLPPSFTTEPYKNEVSLRPVYLRGKSDAIERYLRSISL